MYKVDCLPDANVKLPRLAERAASSEMSWSRLDMAVLGMAADPQRRSVPE